MAIQFGRGDGDESAPIMDINTTPLIDVMLVLLVMLIITIPIQLHAVNLNLPVARTPPLAVKPTVIRIHIDERNLVHWNDDVVSNRAELEARMALAAAQSQQPEVHLRPHPRARYKTVAEVMVSADRLGLKKLGIVGNDALAGG